MGKKLKRKAEEKVVQTTDSPKKAKVENINVSEQKTTKVKKQKGPKNNKTDANDVNSPNSNKENKQNTPQQNNEEANKTGKKAGNKKNKNSPKVENAGKSSSQQNNYKEGVIPAELAKDMNKRQKQSISKKVKILIKLRESRGEVINKDEINKLVKEVMEQKTNPPKDNEETSIPANKTADKNEKSKPTKKQKKGGNKKPNM